MNGAGSDKPRENGHATALLAPVSPQVTGNLLHALRNTGVSAIYQDVDLRLVWARNLPADWQTGAWVGATDRDLLPGDQADRLTAKKRTVLSTLETAQMTLAFPRGSELRWFDFWIDVDMAEDGGIRGLLTTAVDQTDQKRREQTLTVLLREVSHRSKNLLAIIQSIATQTGRYSGTIDTFLSRFRGRLQSLASSQDLVTSSNWRGADLHDLVIGQVGRYTPDPARSILFEGARPYLNPNAALHIGLAMHELAVNSVSYGALSRPGGFVIVAAKLEGASDDHRLALSWNERIAPMEKREVEKRFGSIALERVVPMSLGGTADLRLEGDRLEYRLLMPAGSFEIETEHT